MKSEIISHLATAAALADSEERVKVLLEDNHKLRNTLEGRLLPGFRLNGVWYRRDSGGSDDLQHG